MSMSPGIELHLLHVTCPESAGTHAECHFEFRKDNNAFCRIEETFWNHPRDTEHQLARQKCDNVRVQETHSTL